jgi:hypothetical protein
MKRFGRAEFQDSDRVLIPRRRVATRWFRIPGTRIEFQIPMWRIEHYSEPFFVTAAGTLTQQKWFYYDLETGEVVEDPFVI